MQLLFRTPLRRPPSPPLFPTMLPPLDWTTETFPKYWYSGILDAVAVRLLAASKYVMPSRSDLNSKSLTVSWSWVCWTLLNNAHSSSSQKMLNIFWILSRNVLKYNARSLSCNEVSLRGDLTLRNGVWHCLHWCNGNWGHQSRPVHLRASQCCRSTFWLSQPQVNYLGADVPSLYLLGSGRRLVAHSK